MPREKYNSKPKVINHVQSKSSAQNYLEVATTNENKLREFRRILTGYEVVGKKLDVDEIQSLDPQEVASKKAKQAWEKNGYNPILVEDTSLEIMGLGGRPGTYINDFASEVEMRRLIAEQWLEGKDRRATARVILAIFDGAELHVREGKITGKIAKELRGSNGFGWDDMFIPDGQAGDQNKTFAEMEDIEKDKYSMRRKALENLQNNIVALSYPIFMVPEPFQQELERVKLHKLKDAQAIKFAYTLECLHKNNEATEQFTAENYSPIEMSEERFFTRYIADQSSTSLGLLVTDVDRSNLRFYENGYPVIWQMGPERRLLALAQRAEYFMENQHVSVVQAIRSLERSILPTRHNRRSVTIEKALGLTDTETVTRTIALKEIAYKKISSSKIVSRGEISKYGLFNKIGKYPRSILGIGSMPAVSGWRDTLVTAALGHMPIFTHRNSLNAIEPARQIQLIADAKEVLKSLEMDPENYERAARNIGAALGTANPLEELQQAKRLYKDAGVKMFRIYTINGDPRLLETPRILRQEFGDEVEIFVGQLSDKEQALRLIADDIKADGLVYGHGGGRQCTSATNGMGVTTLEELYDVLTDPRFNDTTIVAEGGIGTSVGALLLMGVDLILYNQQLVKGCIELSDIFFEHKEGKFCQPYHGSASAPTMLIESSNPELLEKRMYISGRAKNVEGKPGYSFYKQKANSMAYHVNQFRHYAARTLADMGVSSIAELRQLLQNDKREFLRIISYEAAHTGSAYKDSR